MRTIVLVAAAILAASFYISSPLAGIHSGGGARGMASASATEPCVGEIDANQCPVWVETFSNPGGQNGSCMGLNVPQGAAVGPSDVYVTGYSCDSNDHGLAGNDIFTIAYDQATGAQRWVARYSGPGAPGDAIGDSGWGVAVSPAGDRVYVTGGQNGGLGSGPSGDFRFVSDYVTIAYDAATGNQLWVASYHGPAAGPDEAEQIAVSEDGLRVFVTGESQAPDVDGRSGGSEVATISYDAQTGAQDWVFRHRVSTAPPQPGDRNNAIGVSSLAVHGSRVYTAGAYALSGVGAGYEILALLDDRDAHEGRLLWAASSDPAINYRLARDSLAITPSGVILTGSTSSTVGPPDTCPPQQTSGAANSQYATVALDPDTGAIRWSATYAGQTGGNNAAFSLAANPSGDRVFVTGQASGAAPTCAIGFATISYDAETGQQEWLTSETVPPGIAPQAFAVAASPDGDQVFVAGLEYHVETMGEKGDSRIIGYDANTGTLRWSGRYNTGTLVGATDLDLPYLVRVSADSSRVFVAEKAIRNIQYQIDNTRFAFGTLAYDTSPATSQQYAAHAPIFIDGADPTAGFVITDPATGQVNWDLTRATTGVVSGDGSAANPFVIEQWTILIDPSFVTSKVFEARSTGTSGLFESYGVEVRNTNAHFVIRDVEVVGETPPTLSTVGYGADHVWVGGIRLLGTGNATIERVDVHDGHRGIWAERAPDLVLRDCSAHDNHDSNALSYQFAYGMVIKNSPRALVENCDVHDNDGWGVYVSTSPDARLSNVTAHHMYG
ncbi:MAG: PQQ-binding-like beta-propeller repeat protein, partial [Candidatus Thermoplasmatota archaeon]